jgi:hypothetical protein
MFSRVLLAAAFLVWAITPIAVVGSAAPRAAVQVFLERGPEVRPDPKTKAELARLMGVKGFSLVDLQGASPFSIDRADDMKKALESARRAGADVLVVGRTSTASESGRQSLAGTKTATTVLARVELRAIRTDSGDVLWSDVEKGTSLEAAATSVGTRFLDEVLAQWRSTRESADKRLLVRVSDASGKLKIADLKEFKEVLFAVDGVEEVVQRMLDKHQAVLDVLYTKDRPSLERSIQGAPVGDKRIALKGVVAGEIIAVLEPPSR